MGVSGSLCRFLKEVKPLVLYAVEHGIAMEQMRGKWASPCVDFGYTDLFCIPDLTSEFISSCSILATVIINSLPLSRDADAKEHLTEALLSPPSGL